MAPVNVKGNLVRFAKHLTALAGLWQNGQLMPLWLDPRSGVALTKNAGRTERIVTPVPSRLRRQLSFKRRIPLNVDLFLPSDAVIFGPERIQGPVIASANSMRVLKFVTHTGHYRGRFDNEVTALRLAEEAGLSNYVPKLIDSDYGGSEFGWILSELVPNSGWTFSEPASVRRRLWMRWLNNEGAEVLFKFYNASCPQVLSIHAIKEEVRRIADGLTNLEIRSIAADFIMRTALYDDVEYVECRIHGDLSRKHLHVYDRGWKIIDWGESKRRPLYMEFLPFYAPDNTAGSRAKAWEWLAGRTTAPYDVKWYMRMQEKWMGKRIADNELRMTVLSFLMLFVVDVSAIDEGRGGSLLYSSDGELQSNQWRLQSIIGWIKSSLESTYSTMGV